MTWLTKLSKLVKEERGAMAVMVAMGLTALVGFTGAAVDLGSIYSAKAELQNANDAAVLAAAQTMITYDEDLLAVATPEDSFAQAHSFTGKHTAVQLLPEDPEDPQSEKVPVTTPLVMLDDDFEIGRWDHESGDFEVTGFSGDPDDLTAVRVKLRRDDLANNPVSTFFAKMAGMDDVKLRTSAVAFLGYAGSVPPGVPPGEDGSDAGGGTEGGGLPVLPICILAGAIGDGENFPNGMYIEFHSENNETGQWHAFFHSHANDPIVKNYVNQNYLSPPVKIGDYLSTINGNLSVNTFRALEGRFKTPVGEGGRNNGTWEEPEPWLVYLPVVELKQHCGCHQVKVVGFVTYEIHSVRSAPFKDVGGFVRAGYVIPNSITTGADFGTRATRPVIYNTEG